MLTPLGPRSASACTANFVFAGGGAMFIGYAAHCAGGGGSMGLNGCEQTTLPLGSSVFIERRDGARSVGTLAYSSWTTMQAVGETSDALCFFNDFALVKIDPDDAGSVDPSVPVLGGPTGLDSDGTEQGEPVFSYQPIASNQSVKQGVSLGDRAGGLTHRVTTRPPGDQGDSGAAFLDGDGEAFGVLSTRFLDGRNSNGVADLASALAYANQNGGVGVSLVRGTAPFTPVSERLARVGEVPA